MQKEGATPKKFYRARISFTSTGSTNADRLFESDFSQVKFQELLGRYTLKYDPPIDMMGTGKIHEYEFYKRHDPGTTTINLRFWEIAEHEVKLTESTTYTAKESKSLVRVEPETIVVPKEPNPPQIEAFLSLNVLKES
jgi:hypothetical protein